MKTQTDIAIIGGGITGLSAAFQVNKEAKDRRKAIQCTVFEQDNRFGGKIKTHREGGFVMECGPDSLLARKPAGPQLIQELGVESEMVGTNPSVGKTYVLSNGRLVPLPTGINMGVPVMLRSFLQTKLISVPGKLRALSDIFLPQKISHSDEPLGKFLRRRLGDEIVDLLCEPILAGIYAASIDQLSVQATFPEFQKMTNSNRSLILGSMRLFRNRPKPSPGKRSIFVSLRHGLETLPEQIIQSVQHTSDLLVNTRVTQMLRREDGTYDIHFVSNQQSFVMQANAIILAAPAPVAGQLLESLIPSASLLRAIPYVSTATVIMAYPKQSISANLDASGFVVPRRENRAITASTWLSTKWPHTTVADHVMIRCYVGRANQQEYLKLSDADMVQLVQTELRDIVGITATPVFSKVTRWDEAMPQYVVNHLQTVSQVEHELATSLPGVFVSGAGYRGVGIPDCIAQGRGAANMALSHLGMSY